MLLSSSQCFALDPVSNVILVTMDGLRWQEVFGGLDETMLGDKANGTNDVAEINRLYAGNTAEERRARLMPFFWNVIAEQGVVFGDQEDESHVHVTNGMNFSYPGYSELLCGFPDSGIDSNAKINNPNITVLEWLHAQQSYQGRVAGFGSWEVLPWIINTERSGIPVNAGWSPLAKLAPNSGEIDYLDRLADEIPRYWAGVRYDVFTFSGANHYLRSKKPKILYVALDETDDWAHAARYDLYLDAARRGDNYIRQLWDTAQSMAEYCDRTALVMTTDHGRGDDRLNWRSHGSDVEGSERIWAAVLSPTVAPSTDVPGNFTQAQIAATVAALLGHDYAADVEKAAPSLPLRGR